MTEVRSDGIFVSCTLPDISPRSHVVAVVGTHDHDDAANPDEDGWFLSDFYMFNHLFAGLCKRQSWYTCLAPEKLVDKYVEYAHGNPYQKRSIVLDREKLAGAEKPRDVIVVREEELLDKFLSGLRSECSAAQQAGDPVLLFILGHGDKSRSGVHVGRFSNGRPALLSLDSIQSLLREYPGLRLTAIFTSCFSGGWTAHVNMTTMAAAGKTKVSESWPLSHSCGRATGSIFASAILEILKEEDMQVDPKTASEVSYEQFTEEVKAKLMLLDKFGSQHNVQFSAQEDDWEAEYHARTGIPRATFSARLQLLRSIPSSDATTHPFGDRTTDAQLKIWGQAPASPSSSGLVTTLKGSMRGRHGGTKISMQSIMKVRAAEYLNSFPGRASLSPNHTAHKLATMCVKNQSEFEDLDRLASILDYREKAMKVAVALVHVLRLEPFDPHWTWDMHQWDLRPEVQKRLNSTKTSALDLVHQSRLIPDPGKDESYPWPKPASYLCAALIAHTKNDKEVAEKIKEGEKWLDGQINLAAKHVTVSMTMRGRKRTWVQTFRTKLRSISPAKRLSFGGTAGSSSKGPGPKGSS
ncbi:MAG: hypothetical protein M4579_005822 [Chaenotheca gracillima]|nr:MAG: hypothetical protein M4579_005822 [Chaenotheca gracillima]